MSLGVFLVVSVLMVFFPLGLLGVVWRRLTQRGMTAEQRQRDDAYNAGWWRGYMWGRWR